MDILAWRMG